MLKDTGLLDLRAIFDNDSLKARRDAYLKLQDINERVTAELARLMEEIRADKTHGTLTEAIVDLNRLSVSVRGFMTHMALSSAYENDQTAVRTIREIQKTIDITRQDLDGIRFLLMNERNNAS